MKMNNQKGFANIVLIIVVVAIVAVGGYFVFVKKSEPVAQQPTPTPTPKDETSSWKTYSNATYGFEVKYPNTWQQSGNDSSFASSSKCRSFDAMTQDAAEFKGCQRYSLNFVNNKMTREGEGLTKSTITVAGISAEKTADLGGLFNDIGQTDVQFQRNGQWYHQAFYFHTSERVTAENTLNQILSTFKFTK